jgi:hypothetical protein
MDDDDYVLRPADASDLTLKQVTEELASRSLKPTGFPEDDIKLLQRAFNEEFEREKEERSKKRAEALERRKAEEAALSLQRFMERQVRNSSDLELVLHGSGKLIVFSTALRYYYVCCYSNTAQRLRFVKSVAHRASPSTSSLASPHSPSIPSNSHHSPSPRCHILPTAEARGRRGLGRRPADLVPDLAGAQQHYA